MEAKDYVVQNAMEDPKSTTAVVDLPCGYLAPDGNLYTEVQIREMSAAEEDILASSKTKVSKKMNTFIGSCIERIGPITDKGQIIHLTNQLLLGDRVFLLFAIRSVSFTENYTFEETCPECDKPNFFSVDLSDLDVKKMPEPKKRVYERQLPSGRVVTFHPACGADESRVSDVTSSTDNLSSLILMRVDTINGKPIGIDAIKKLPSRDCNALRDIFNEVEGGVDTEVPFDCPKCGAEFRRDVNIDASFFFPSVARKISKKK